MWSLEGRAIPTYEAKNKTESMLRKIFTDKIHSKQYIRQPLFTK